MRDIQLAAFREVCKAGLPLERGLASRKALFHLWFPGQAALSLLQQVSACTALDASTPPRQCGADPRVLKPPPFPQVGGPVASRPAYARSAAQPLKGDYTSTSSQVSRASCTASRNLSPLTRIHSSAPGTALTSRAHPEYTQNCARGRTAATSFTKTSYGGCGETQCRQPCSAKEIGVGKAAAGGRLSADFDTGDRLRRTQELFWARTDEAIGTSGSQLQNYLERLS